MLNTFQIELIGLSLLGSYLCLSVGWRHRRELRSGLAKLKQWVIAWPQRRQDRRYCREFVRSLPSPNLNAPAILPRVGQLRREHPAAAHARFRRPVYRHSLICVARSVVQHSAYIRAAGAQDTVPPEDTTPPRGRVG